MRWLLRLLVSDGDRRAIEHDLAELYEFRRLQDGDRAARRWLRRQRLLYPLHLIVGRLRGDASDRMATMPYLWRDLLHSVRSLVRTPALAVTIVLTVGIGIGATTGMIGVIRAVLVSPLPYAEPESLFWIYTDNPPYRFRFSVVDYRALEADHPAFSAVAAYQTATVTVADGSASERVTAKSVTGSYFPLLRQRPRLGRLFDENDDGQGDRIAVLTSGYWARRFGADPNVVGRTIGLDGASFTIVGVLDEATGPLEGGVAVFTAERWAPPTRKGPFFTMAIARLRPGVSQDVAVQSLQATNARLFPIWRSSYQDEKATWGMQDLKSRVVGDVGSTLYFVLAAVGCVLLIACANAVNLLVGRALSRGRELAIRGALGASRGRLLQHLMAETMVLTIGAAGVGLAIAVGTMTLVTTYGMNYIPRLAEVRLASPVLGWLATLTVGSGLLIGLVPAIHSSRLRMDRTLRSGGRSASDGPAARRLRRTLVAAEFALATPLIVTAMLVMSSLDRLSRVEVGIDTDRVLTASVSLPSARYSDDAGRRAFWDRTLERLARLPGVDAIALTDSRPPAEGYNSNNFDLEDRPAAGDNQPISVWVAASPDFFKTVGLTHLRGRLFAPADLLQDAPPVIVVDRAWAERFFPDQEVLGRRLREGGCTECPWTTVVGLVTTVKYNGLDAADQGTVYYPFVAMGNAFVTLRTGGDPSALQEPLRQAIRELDPGLALADVASGDDLVADSLAQPRYLSVVVGLFAISALALSIVGIYGVMAHFVQQHTRDIGIRLALGGVPSDVRRMIVVQGLRLVAAGVALGVITAMMTSTYIGTLLFDVSPTDVTTLVTVPGLLLLVAAIACAVPARRAARTDPAEILRES